MEPLFQIENELDKKDIDKLSGLLWKYGSKSYFHLPLWEKFPYDSIIAFRNFDNFFEKMNCFQLYR